jgi:polyhydroxyalkanoate synthase
VGERGPHPLALHSAGLWPAALKDTPLLEAGSRVMRALAGIRAYQTHPYRRSLDALPVAAQSGSATLLCAAKRGTPIVLVPSLVNPSVILDLDQETSLLRWLAAHGCAAHLVDWGEPGAEERGFDLADYVTQRLIPLIGQLGAPVTLVGYCLGGLLTLAAAQAAPQLVQRLVLLATPWDFAGYEAQQRQNLIGLWAQWQTLATTLGVLPMDILQIAFIGLDPGLTLKKFVRFSSLAPDSAEARAFVTVEDWANAGPPLTLGAARDCFEAFYGLNAPAKGAWQVAGRAVDPAAIACPTLALTSLTDRLVPSAAAEPLARAIPGAVHRPVAAGHVGMIIGSKARATVWQPLLDFCHDGVT